ncbi:hypothetical protein [Nocardia sp. NPDC052566]|uniref:hypothetical protein n=1 Tax=Nocardia sp. NPDC052566 TaxID=3364330 RepID=UPI0037C57DDA
MKNDSRAVSGTDLSPEPAERADLVAWRRRHAIRQSNAAQPIANKRRYRRGSKHRKQAVDS